MSEYLFPDPQQPAPPPFRSDRRELIAALLSYLPAYLYVRGFLNGSTVCCLLFCAAFTACGLLYFRGNIRSGEHWVWLFCTWLCILCGLYGQNRVWGDLYTLFAHCFALYWILTLSQKLTEGVSSAFLPLDAFNAAVLLPFSGFFTFFRTRVLFWGVRQLRDQKLVDLTKLLAAALAVVVALILFFSAGGLLSQADTEFGTFFASLLPVVNDVDAVDLIVSLIMSIPVGAYLYGLFTGADRLPAAVPEKRKNGILKALSRLRHVPNGVWTVLICVFIALYLLFFGFQSRYFFGAFSRLLPEELTVAQYARQGFFELCRVMGLNFSLLWLILGSSARPVRQDRPLRSLCTVLLAESFLFAVTALSKLLLYIDCFGFTPLRLQSFWLVCVLLLGCILSAVSLWTEKKTIRLWILFSGVTLALLHLY